MQIKELQLRTVNFAPWLLIIFHIIGLTIMLTPDRAQGLSGFNMLVCSVMVLLSAQTIRKEFRMLVFIYMGGMLVEIIGVATGLLFGTYEYGEELGFKIMGVPLVLGLNWYCIVAASANLVLHFLVNLPTFLKALLAAAACTFLDFFIEPVATVNDFWYWEGGIIPVYNYLCWFVFSFIFSFVYLYKAPKVNNTAIVLFFIWFMFFAILNLV